MSATTAATKEPETRNNIGSYEEVIECNNGLLNVRKCRKWGYIDKDGNKITPIKYDGPSHNFVDGKVLVKFNRSYYVIDEKTGEEHEI